MPDTVIEVHDLGVYLFSWDSKNATRRGHPSLALVAWLPYLAGLLLSL